MSRPTKSKRGKKPKLKRCRCLDPEWTEVWEQHGPHAGWAQCTCCGDLVQWLPKRAGHVALDAEMDDAIRRDDLKD